MTLSRRAHMDAALRDLLDLLDLEQIDRDIFRGRSPDEAGSAYTADKSLAKHWSLPQEP